MGSTSAWQIANYGTILGTGNQGNGIVLASGGSVTNKRSGSAAGYITSVDIHGSPGTIINYGTISGGLPAARLPTGGTVSNAAGALIAGLVAVYLKGAGTITNQGTITQSQFRSGINSNAVSLLPSGSGIQLTNGTSGLISGSVGASSPGATIANFGTVVGYLYAPTVVVNGASGSSNAFISNGVGDLGSALTNFGTILGMGGRGTGAAVQGSGTVLNLGTINGVHVASGAIRNGQSDSTKALITGVGIYVRSGSAFNFGTIVGTTYGGYGAFLRYGSPLFNIGLISGTRDGVRELDSGGTISNTGTIIGGNGTIGTGIVTAAAVIIGYSGSTLGLIAGGQYGNGIYKTPSITNFGTIRGGVGVMNLRTLVLATIANAGTIIGTSGTAIAFSGAGVNRLVVAPGAVFDGIVTGGAADNILELAGGAGAGRLNGLGSSFTSFSTVAFDAGAAWTVGDDNSAAFTGTFTGFATGDVIDLTRVVADGDTYNNDQLTLTNSGTVVATLNIAGHYTTSQFMLSSDGAGGTDIALTQPGQTSPLAVAVQLKIVSEGAPVSGAVATFTDDNSSDAANGFTASIEWGDGTTSTGTITGSSGSFAIGGNHIYTDEGSEMLSVSLTRSADNARASASGTVAVGEGDTFTPRATSFTAIAGEPFSGTVATFSDTDTLTDASDLSASINWGDGTTTAGTVSGSNGSFSVSGSRTYEAASQDTVSVTLADNPPGTASATGESIINVTNSSAPPAPIVVTADLIMRDGNNGAFEIYGIGDNMLVSAAPLGEVGLEFTVAGFGDFSGVPNETDMLMRDGNNGAFELYDIVGIRKRRGGADRRGRVGVRGCRRRRFQRQRQRERHADAQHGDGRLRDLRHRQ